MMLTSGLNLGCAVSESEWIFFLFEVILHLFERSKVKTSMPRLNVSDMVIHFSWFVFRGFYGVLNRIPDAK